MSFLSRKIRRKITKKTKSKNLRNPADKFLHGYVAPLSLENKLANLGKITLLLVGLATQADAANFSLKGTMWERASSSASCRPDPLLLYSVALKEARTMLGGGMIAPHPFALRNEPSGPVFPSDYVEARSKLARYIQEDELTDIGIMQINYYWNGRRVTSVEDLLDPETNIKVGAKILCESIAQYPTDMLLAIGGYHTKNPKRQTDARRYAQDVLAIWRSIQRL